MPADESSIRLYTDHILFCQGALVNAESWLVGEEAAGYFDFEVEQDVQAAACASDFFRQYAHTPEGLGADMPGNQGKSPRVPGRPQEDDAAGGSWEGVLSGRGLDTLADAVLARIRAKGAARKDEETEKIKDELLGDLCLYGV